MDKLECAQEGLERGDWEEVESCLIALAKEVTESKLPYDEVEKIKGGLEGLKFNINSIGVPEEYKDRIVRSIESAEKCL